MILIIQLGQSFFKGINNFHPCVKTVCPPTMKANLHYPLQFFELVVYIGNNTLLDICIVYSGERCFNASPNRPFSFPDYTMGAEGRREKREE